MFASCQILVRAAALLFATGMFAGLWVNDRHFVESRESAFLEVSWEPTPTPIVISEEEWSAWVAVSAEPTEQTTLVDVSVTAVGEEVDVNDDDEWQSVIPAPVAFERSSVEPEESSVEVSPTPVAQRRSVDSELLSLPLSVIQRHLDLLPSEIPSGDYRIIDPYGGVGWLFIRSLDGSRGKADIDAPKDGVWTTSMDGVSVRFIRAAPQPDRII